MEIVGNGNSGGVDYTYICTITALDSGTYEWMLGNFFDSKQEYLETKEFEMGGFKWRLLLYPHQEFYGQEYISVYLASMNDVTLSVDFNLTSVNHTWPQDSLVSGQTFTFRSKEIHGFYCFQHVETIRRPENGFLMADCFVLKAMLKVRPRPEDQFDQLMASDNAQMVEVVILTDQHFSDNVERTLPWEMELGSEQLAYLYPDTWLIQNLLTKVAGDLGFDKNQIRLWRCQMEDGCLAFQEQMEMRNVPPMLSLKDIAQAEDDSDIKLRFYLEAPTSGELPELLEDSWILFCKLFDTTDSVLKYLGNIVVQKSDRTFGLMQLGALAQIPPGKPFDLYINPRNGDFRKLDEFGTIESSGLHHGSVLIICVREQDAPLNAERLQQELLKYHQTKLLLSLNEVICPSLNLDQAEQNEDRLVDLREVLENQNEPEESEEDEEDEEPECVVCMCCPATSGFLHENTTHKCVCEVCLETIMAQDNPQCPICRQKIERAIKKFF